MTIFLALYYTGMAIALVEMLKSNKFNEVSSAAITLYEVFCCLNVLFESIIIVVLITTCYQLVKTLQRFFEDQFRKETKGLKILFGYLVCSFFL